MKVPLTGERSGPKIETHPVHPAFNQKLIRYVKGGMDSYGILVYRLVSTDAAVNTNS